jgi:hypothetical protein
MIKLTPGTNALLMYRFPTGIAWQMEISKCLTWRTEKGSPTSKCNKIESMVAKPGIYKQ